MHYFTKATCDILFILLLRFKCEDITMGRKCCYQVHGNINDWNYVNFNEAVSSNRYLE